MPMTSHSYAAPSTQNTSGRPSSSPRKGENTTSGAAFYTHSPYWYQDAPVLEGMQEDDGTSTPFHPAQAPWGARPDREISRTQPQTPYSLTPQLSRVPSETGHRTSDSSSQEGSTCSGERVFPSSTTAVQPARPQAQPPRARLAHPICAEDDQTLHHALGVAPAARQRPSLPPAYGTTHAYCPGSRGGEDPTLAMGGAPDPTTPYHTPLAGVCDFLSLPQALPTPLHWPAQRYIETDGFTHRVFIGHVRFETTAEQIAFVIQHACGVVPAWVVNHRMGCFVVHLDSEEEWRKVLAYHKRIYFDTVGVWIARTPAALVALKAEVEAVSDGPRSFTFRRCRLPRSAMVIEPFTDDDAGSPKRVSGRAKQHY